MLRCSSIRTDDIPSPMNSIIVANDDHVILVESYIETNRSVSCVRPRLRNPFPHVRPYTRHFENQAIAVAFQDT
ncbi:hypothetical protein PsorP6_001757 [Peronosclerospora sorghi]|uniref:Uncharacterized protein n=1 Tax=Peronosclerospora sorghi TaxID=230839 RepID=A0ACC0WU68_9STRA|nr:hypothetical protein PsorP6_001757 [Peronosclerospora sorghi]